MTEYFKQEYLIEAKKHRQKSLIFYFSVLGVYVLASVGLFIWYLLLPYESPNIKTVKLIEYPLTVVFVIFSFIYLGISGKRVKNYYALLKKLDVGIKETSRAIFIRYDDRLSVKDGVDVKSLVFSEWNKYKNEFYERKVLVLYEKDFPELTEDTEYTFVTVGNVLISYEES